MSGIQHSLNNQINVNEQYYTEREEQDGLIFKDFQFFEHSEHLKE